VDRPILGADFLADFHLLVDPAMHKVLQLLQHPALKPLAPPVRSPADSSVGSVSKLTPDVTSQLDEYPAARKPCLPGQLPSHHVEHVIKTEGQRLYARPRRLMRALIGRNLARISIIED